MYLVPVTFKINEKLLEELDAIAREKGITRSEAIRQAIEMYLRLKGYVVEQPYKMVRLLN